MTFYPQKSRLSHTSSSQALRSQKDVVCCIRKFMSMRSIEICLNEFERVCFRLMLFCPDLFVMGVTFSYQWLLLRCQISSSSFMSILCLRSIFSFSFSDCLYVLKFLKYFVKYEGNSLNNIFMIFSTLCQFQRINSSVIFGSQQTSPPAY